MPGSASIPTAAPPEVLDALDRAAGVIAELEDLGLRVLFELRGDRRLDVRIVDGEGRIVQELSPAAVTELLQGALDADSLGLTG